jgi:hypothetical protein
LPEWRGRRTALRALALGISLAAHAAIYFSAGSGAGAAAGPAHDAVAASKVMTVSLVPAGVSGEAGGGSDAGQPARTASAEPPAPARNDDAALFPLPAPQRPYYFPASQLTQKPLVLQDIPANLTLDLPDAPAQAAVLRLLINEAGGIDKVMVDELSVPEAAAQAIAEAFRHIRFRPGEKDGTPVKSQLKIEIMLESLAEPSSPAMGLP